MVMKNWERKSNKGFSSAKSLKDWRNKVNLEESKVDFY